MRGLVLLHGLGATREVWAPLIGLAETGGAWRCLALDLPGHGQAARLDRYDAAGQAAEIARQIAAAGLAEGAIVLGHSLGGVLALVLAAGEHGVRPSQVLALGVKVVWTHAEIAAMAARAAKPSTVFDRLELASAQHLRVSGLAGLAAADSPMALAGVAQDEAGWRLALDPRAYGVGPPDVRGLLDRARAPVALACGGADPMCDGADLRGLAPEAAVLGGLGHNAMVEDPAAVLAWLNLMTAKTVDG